MAKYRTEAEIKVKVKKEELKKLNENFNDVKKQLDDLKNNNAGEKLNNNFKKLNETIGKTKPTTDGVGKSFFNLSNILKSFVAFKVGEKFLSIAKASMQASSNMTELENITKQVFGNMAKDVDMWSKKMGEAIGRSTYQLKKATTDVANIFKGYGDFFSTEQIKTMSQNLAELSIDMGSFLNISDERANIAITAAITGEAEALKRLGFNLQDTTIKEYALAKGIKKKYEEMTGAEKAQLRYEKLMEITKHVQGDAARTIDTYANQFKQLEANIGNLAVKIGDRLVPSTNAILRSINNVLSGFNNFISAKTNVEILGDAIAKELNLKRLVEEFENLDGEVKKQDKTSKEYKDTMEKLKSVESQLIEANPDFLQAFQDKADKIGAVKKIYDETTKSIYKMMFAENKEARLSSVTKSYGSKLSNLQEKKLKFQEDLIKDLNQRGIDKKSIELVLKYGDKNVTNNARVNKELSDVNSTPGNMLNQIKLIDGMLETTKNNFDIEINKVNKLNDELAKMLNIDVSEVEKQQAKKVENKGASFSSVGSSSKEAEAKSLNRWQQMEKNLHDFKNSIDDVKLPGILGSIKKLNDDVTTKQIEKLKNLIGILSPSEIIEGKIKIYNEHLSNLMELAKGSKDTSVLKKIEVVKQKLATLNEDLEVEKLNENIKNVINGESQRLKDKKTELGQAVFNKDLKEITAQENAGLFSILEASKLRLEALRKQKQILIENGKLDEATTLTLKEQNLQIQSNIQKLEEQEQHEKLSNELKKVLGDIGAENSRIETAKRNYEANLNLLLQTLENLPAELKGKIKIESIEKNLIDIEKSANISNEAKQVAKSIKLLFIKTNEAFKSIEKNTLTSYIDRAKQLGDALGLDGFSDTISQVDSILKNALSGNIFGAVTGGFSILSKLFTKRDDGSKKIKFESEKNKEKWNDEIIKSNNNLIYSVDNLANDMKNFNKTLIKNIAADTSNSNIYKNQKIAEEMGKVYLQAFNPLVKTQIQRKTWVDTPWYQLGTTDHWEYGGTETEEKALKKILGISEFKSTEQIREIYKQWKGRKYEGNFEDRGHEGNFFGTEKQHYKELVGSNLDEVLEAMLQFADKVDKNTKEAKQTARYGIMQSMDGLEVTSASQLKEQAMAQMKKLIEASGQDYSKVAGNIEKKLDEIIKEDEVIISAFNETRGTIISNVAKGEDTIQALGNGLQSYFNKIRSNISKIKYDFQFRDIESGFNKKFKELTEELTKMRLQNEKNLNPKFLNFSELFKQMKEMEKASNSIRDVVTELREQARAAGISEDVINKMLPLDEVLNHASKISSMLSQAMEAALSTDSFEQFSMSIGDSLYKVVKDNLIKAFSESAKFKKLYEDYIDNEAYKKELDKAKTIKEAYSIIQNNLNKFENKLKAEGLAFRETRAHNGEYLGGFSNTKESPGNFARASQGLNITLNTTIENKGFLAIDDLTESLTEKLKSSLNSEEGKEA